MPRVYLIYINSLTINTHTAVDSPPQLSLVDAVSLAFRILNMQKNRIILCRRHRLVAARREKQVDVARRALEPLYVQKSKFNVRTRIKLIKFKAIRF